MPCWFWPLSNHYLLSRCESTLLLISILFLFCLFLYLLSCLQYRLIQNAANHNEAHGDRFPTNPDTWPYPASIQERTFSKNVAILWGRWCHVYLKLFGFKVTGSTLRWPEMTKRNNSSPHIPPPLPPLKVCLSHREREDCFMGLSFPATSKGDIHISHRPWHSERIYASLLAANIFILVQHFVLQMPTGRHSWL